MYVNPGPLLHDSATSLQTETSLCSKALLETLLETLVTSVVRPDIGQTPAPIRDKPTTTIDAPLVVVVAVAVVEVDAQEVVPTVAIRVATIVLTTLPTHLGKRKLPPVRSQL